MPRNRTATSAPGLGMEHGRKTQADGRVASRACTSQLRATQARTATARVSPKSLAARKLLTALLAAVRTRLYRGVSIVKQVNVLYLDARTSYLAKTTLWQSSPEQPREIGENKLQSSPRANPEQARAAQSCPEPDPSQECSCLLLTS